MDARLSCESGRKRPCETDARVAYVELTPRGRRLRRDFDEIFEILLSTLYGDMSKRHREQVVELLENIENNLSG